MLQTMVPLLLYVFSSTSGVRGATGANIRANDAALTQLDSVRDAAIDHLGVSVLGDDATLRFAAAELRRYTYATTGAFLPITAGATANASIVIGVAGHPLLKGIDAPTLGDSADAHSLSALPGGGALLLGNSPRGALYAAYSYCTTVLRVGFQVDGDVLPPRRSAPHGAAQLSAAQAPRFGRRGAVPYHDFAMGPVRAAPRFAVRGACWFYAYPMGQDWWQADDYKAFATNMAKMRLNFIATVRAAAAVAWCCAASCAVVLTE